jgi:putative FmdB family regulatory protein
MPIYEYQCTKCHEVCEVLQKAKDKPPEKCPKCGGPVVKRISSPAIQFKGTGWYITDYAKKNSTSAGTKAESKSPAKDEAKADAKAEPASETKSEPKAGPAAADKSKPDKSSS